MEIKVSNLSYQDNKIKLEDICLDFCFSKIYSIIGPSGSGKTYLGKLIAGVLEMQQGEIHYDKLTISASSNTDYCDIKRKIGYVSENVVSEFVMATVFDELSLKIKEQHYRETELEKRIDDALKMVGLSHSFCSRDPRTLSTGERQKLAIARALICNPKVLILDEPTIGLDPFEQKKLIKLIRMLKNRYHRIVIIISNDLEFLLPVSDNMIVLNQGNVLMNDHKYKILKETSKLKRIGIQVPKMIEFSDMVLKKKKIKIGYRDLMNDLIKDIYRHAEWGVRKNNN